MAYLRATYETLGEVNPVGLMSRIEHNAIGWDDVLSIERPAWQADAACRGMDQSLFFTGKGENAILAEARQVCAGCPVRAECREYGLYERHGLWGGLTERERRQLRTGKARRAKPCETGDAR